MAENGLNIPIALIIFKRPETTQQVLKAIAVVKPQRLFVIGDGPRKDRPDELERVARTRTLINQLDWDCEIQTNYSETNLGLKQRIVSGLNWAFSQAEKMIVLEDDCVPSRSFFLFCQDLLARYQRESRLMAIGGVNYQFGRNPTPYSYYFSIFNHVSGWASWQRAWEFFDPDMKLWPEVRDFNMLNSLFSDHKAVEYWAKRLQSAYDHQIDSWAYCWTLACWANSGLTALPALNLVNNIGSGLDATHSHGRRNPRLHIPAQEISFPLQHPPNIMRHALADEFTQRCYFREHRLAPIKKSLKMLLGRYLEKYR